MKNFVILLLLFPITLFAQKHEKKARNELNKYIEGYVASNGVKWNEIQTYFEHYLISTKFQYVAENTEKGYLNYIKARKKMVVLPSMENRECFKALLEKCNVIDKSNPFVGLPLIKSLHQVNNKYKSRLSENSTLAKISTIFGNMAAKEAINSHEIAAALNTVFMKEELVEPIYKKVVILSLFVDAIYQDEMFCNEISDENPYRNSAEYRNVTNLETGDLFAEVDEVNQNTQKDNQLSDEKHLGYFYNKESGKVELGELPENAIMPHFPGGDLGLRKHIANNVIYPEKAQVYGIEGKVYVRFCVTKTGKIAKVSVAKGVHPLIDEEAIKAVKNLPKWKPGELDGEKVNVWYTVPIQFSLPH